MVSGSGRARAEQHAAVIINIGGNDSQAFPKRLLDGRPLPDLGERTISIVVIKKTCARLEDARDAIVVPADLVVAAL